MKRFILSAILGAAFIIGCAAGGGNAMVGTWELQLSEEAQKKMPAGAPKPDFKIDFKEDGTWSGAMVMGEMKSSAEGTYKLDGKTLTVETTKEDGKAKDKPETETVTLNDDMKSFAMPKSEGMGKMVKK